MIYISISTTYDRIFDLKDGSFQKSEQVKYVVACQGVRYLSDDEYILFLKTVFGDEVLYNLSDGYGLSKNRNNGILTALNVASEHDYIYICDDDVRIDVCGLLSAFELASKESIDMVTGIVTTPNGFFKSYPSNKFKYTKRSIAKISSVEMIVSVKFLKSKHLLFDTRFGLGSQYPSGEEFIFCNEVLRNGGNILFTPTIFCEHPPVSSGQDFFTSDIKVKTKGAMLCRAYGLYTSLILAMFFSIKKWPIYRKSISFNKFTLLILKGAVEFEAS